MWKKRRLLKKKGVLMMTTPKSSKSWKPSSLQDRKQEETGSDL